MEKYCKLVVFAIVLLFYVLALAEAQKKLTSCPRSSNANRTDDIETPSKGGKPDNALKVARSSFKSKRPSDYTETLRKFKCDCHKNKADIIPIWQPNYLDLCPAKTEIFTIGSWYGGCWVDWPFRHRHCPWTRCVNNHRCSHVTPIFGHSWCVYTQYKKVSIYALCWQGSHWQYKKVSIKIPTCCGCRVYCGHK